MAPGDRKETQYQLDISKKKVISFEQLAFRLKEDRGYTSSLNSAKLPNEQEEELMQKAGEKSATRRAQSKERGKEKTNDAQSSSSKKK